MNVNIETNRPVFETMTRAFIEIPEVQRLKIKFKDTMKLKELTYLGISNDPKTGIVLKSQHDKEFTWAAGSFYLFYPVQTQSIVGFGRASDDQLGAPKENFRQPAISKPAAGGEEFRPMEVYGEGRYSVAVGSNRELFETGRLGGGACERSAFTKASALNGAVRLVAVGQESVMVVLEDNTIWCKGESAEHHFPRDASRAAFAALQLWADKSEEEKIVDIASGAGFTLFVTESGQLWARGQRFLEAVDQASKDAVKLKLPAGQLCRRAWAGKAAASPCAFVELEDAETKEKSIYSAGRSEKGLLGQGVNIKESREFKQIAYESKDLSFVSLSACQESVMAIDSQGQLWGWGHNECHRLGLTDVAENGIHKPFALYPLNSLEFRAKRVSCGPVHSLVLFEDKRGKELLYSVGNKSGSDAAHLGVPDDQTQDAERPFREVPTFSDRKVADFLAHDSASLVVLQAEASAAD